jgi:SAM-dependent methyltransferase
MGLREDFYMYKALRFYATHGLRETLKRSAFVIHRRTIVRFKEWRYDRRLGIYTGGDVTYPQSILSGRYAEPYQATSPEIFNRIMQSVGCLTAPFIFLDVGCGKGRVLLMAASHVFTRVVGIEFDSRLAQIARENAARFQMRPECKSNIDVVCEDAARYEFPDENAVIFFFNPFKQEIMSQVLKNIRLSARTTRHRYIIYYNPVLAHLFSDPNEFSIAVKEKEYVIYRMHL